MYVYEHNYICMTINAVAVPRYSYIYDMIFIT